MQHLTSVKMYFRQKNRKCITKPSLLLPQWVNCNADKAFIMTQTGFVVQQVSINHATVPIPFGHLLADYCFLRINSSENHCLISIDDSRT